MSGLCGDQRDLLSANIALREQRDEARASEASARAELETVSLRLAKVENEANCLYDLLCNATAQADGVAATANARIELAKALRE